MAKIEELNTENQQVQSRLAVINQELSKTSEKLVQTETTLANTTETLNKDGNEYVGKDINKL